MIDTRTSFWLRLYTWFAVITVLYFILVSIGLGYHDIFKFDSSIQSSGYWFTNFLGLFVPIGPNNLFVVFVSIPFVLLLIYLVEGILQRLNLSIVTRIICNLAVLFVITFTLDMIFFHEWKSLNIFLNSDCVLIGGYCLWTFAGLRILGWDIIETIVLRWKMVFMHSVLI